MDGRTLRARVDHGARAVPLVLQALEARGLAAESVTVSRPSLDDVYLRYTGRSFDAGRPGDDEMTTLRHGVWMMQRHLLNLWRQPIWIAVTLVQPVIWLLLYGALFKSVTRIPGFHSTSYIQFLTPGIVVMSALFSAGWSGMAVIDDIDKGDPRPLPRLAGRARLADHRPPDERDASSSSSSR